MHIMSIEIHEVNVMDISNYIQHKLKISEILVSKEIIHIIKYRKQLENCNIKEINGNLLQYINVYRVLDLFNIIKKFFLKLNINNESDGIKFLYYIYRLLFIYNKQPFLCKEMQLDIIDIIKNIDINIFFYNCDIQTKVDSLGVILLPGDINQDYINFFNNIKSTNIKIHIIVLDIFSNILSYKQFFNSCKVPVIKNIDLYKVIEKSNNIKIYRDSDLQNSLLHISQCINKKQKIAIIINDVDTKNSVVNFLKYNHLAYNDTHYHYIQDKKGVVLFFSIIDLLTNKFNMKTLYNVLTDNLVNFGFQKDEYKKRIFLLEKYIFNRLEINFESLNSVNYHIRNIKNYPSVQEYKKILELWDIIYKELNKFNKIIISSTLVNFYHECINLFILMTKVMIKIPELNNLIDSINNESILKKDELIFINRFIKYTLSENYYLNYEPINYNQNDVYVCTPVQSLFLDVDNYYILDFNESCWEYDIKNFSIENIVNICVFKRITEIGKNVNIIFNSMINSKIKVESTIFNILKLFYKEIVLDGLYRPNIDVSPALQPSPKCNYEYKSYNLSATSIEKLILDPYAFYIDYILNIGNISDIFHHPTKLNFGNILHSILYQYFTNSALDINTLIECELSKKTKYHIPYNRIWHKKLHSYINQAIAENNKRYFTKLLLEKKLEWYIEELDLTVYAILDRVEFLNDGTLAIIDYKTGQLPSNKDILCGFAPQIMIQAMLAEHVLNKTVSEISFWQFKDNLKIKKIKNYSTVLPSLKEKIIFLLKNYYINDNNKFYASPNNIKKHSGNARYSLLERNIEWELC